MDLTYEELEVLIHKISVGKAFLFVENSFITLVQPNNELKLKARFIYDDSYKAATLSGLLSKKELEILIKERGIFSQEDEDKLLKVTSQMNSQKIILEKTAKVKANQDRLKGIIQALDDERLSLLYKKYSKLYMSSETKAEEDMNNFLCFNCTYNEDGTLFWSSYTNFLEDTNTDLKSKILATFLQLISGISVKQIRALARSTLWRTRYNTSVKTSETLFGVATVDYTLDQLNLTYWSNHYDNIYSMMPSDKPPDEIIQDDEALDKFMDEFYKEMNNETSILKKDKKRPKGSMSAFDSEEVIVTQASELYYEIKYDKPKEAQRVKDRTDIKKRTKSSGGKAIG